MSYIRNSPFLLVDQSMFVFQQSAPPEPTGRGVLNDDSRQAATPILLFNVQKRQVLEESNELEPRASALDEDIEAASSSSSGGGGGGASSGEDEKKERKEVRRRKDDDNKDDDKKLRREREKRVGHRRG